MAVVSDLHSQLQMPLPAVLGAWEKTVEDWVNDYADRHSSTDISEVQLGSAVFLFDHKAERVVLAYALSTIQLHPRDRARMRAFPDVNVSVRAVLGSRAFVADRGHFLGHASGGQLDINLFPHRRELNRGWWEGGQRFRRMERYVASHLGCFFYHRPIYDDATWIPASLEYGVVVDNQNWWRDRFENKIVSAPANEEL